MLKWRAIVDIDVMLMLLLTKVGVEGMVELSPEEVVVLGEGDQAELECKVIASSIVLLECKTATLL